MNFKAYSRLNNIVGWIVFAIAAFTYLSTIEHTVSLWDCGEFTSCDYKLEVPHPPGAPFYTLVYRIATVFAGGNVKMVPILANSMSGLCSAFTILFLFWSITALAFKVAVKDENNIERGTLFAILGAGAVGGLAYTFSDTFWFSAVEAEVYAMSSMFTALVFWLALKWERRANEKGSLKWIILIFYLIGVVIGVHLLGLLVIPIIFLMYYYKKFKNITWKGTLIAGIIGMVALGFVQIFTIQWLPGIGSWFELRFVNDFGMGYWSGIIFFFAVLFLLSGYFIWWSHKKGLVLLNTGLLCFVVVIIGYMSYAACVVRSYANPPIDMNDPEDVFSLIGYLSREQYGDNYLLSGPYYTAFSKEGGYHTEEGDMQYRMDKKTHSFQEAGPKTKLVFDPKYTTIFPRMAHGEDQYINGYKYWGNIKNDDRISFVGNNLRFFFKYQINYMYFRYFAWNFIGRQNDIQGIMNEFHQGNWMTGIPFFDESVLNEGPQKDLPGYLATNKARNKLFALPFLLGILGLLWQYKKNKNDFLVVMAFFIMTGLAIEVYLNMPSPQPRERDYAFVGSFYVYAIWIGLGVMWLFEFLREKMKSVSPGNAAIAATVISLVAVPTLMAAQEWDDHDRSHRTASLDYGVNYLESCAPHAVLFTNGDNDTYPLWYAQEVEGIRDDIRIVNLSLFGTDWYINEMRHPINKAVGLPFSLTEDQTVGWDYVPFIAGNVDQTKYLDLGKVIQFIGSKSPETKYQIGNNKYIPYMPTKKVYIPIDKQAVLNSGTVPADQANRIVDSIKIDIRKNNIMKSDIMVLDFIQANNWKVPIYFSITSGPDDYLYLGQFLQQEGLAYRLLPIKSNVGAGDEDKRVATDLMYTNVMNKFRWGQLDKNETYVDYVLMRQSENMRGVMQKLSRQLMIEGKMDKAKAVADKCMQVIPERNVPYDFYNVPFVEVYYKANAKDQAQKLGMHLFDVYNKELAYYSKLKPSLRGDVQGEIQRAMYGMGTLEQIAEQNNDKTLLDKVKGPFENYRGVFPPEQPGQ
jgi:hypothetical protein